MRQRVLNEAIPRLLDMLEAGERIDRYAVRGREAFEHDELVQNWITNSSRSSARPPRITPDLRESRSEVPWRQIIGMRGGRSPYSVIADGSSATPSGHTVPWAT
jgi:uncharacterized protein with HEPN domain